MKLRVLVVDDSLTVRKRLREVLAASEHVGVIAEARDGREAIALCLSQRPDVITMDMVLPVMSGLAATEYIMAHCPTPILIVSSSFNRGEAFKTYDALAAGAVDVVEKPSGTEADGEWEKAFVLALRMVARVRVITHPRGRLVADAARRTRAASQRPLANVVAIGASTGGPSAVVQVLQSLPSDFSLPVLMVLHLSPTFANPFADWLSTQVSRAVAFAQDGEPLSDVGPAVRLAPPDQHMVLRNGIVRLTSDAERHSCRPAVDELFESLATDVGASTIACLLTGMGRDGAAGLLRLREAGAMTIAQDEATSVVYGMPREAALLGAAMRILPLDEIGPTVAAIAGCEERT